jgi:hypothetical protein
MPRPDFGGFEAHLRHGGVAHLHVTRATSELSDHFDDLVEDALNQGVDVSTAEQSACESLGDLQAIATDIRSRPELRSWAFRHPYLAIVAYPIMCIALVPAVPVIVGVAHASALARWGACLLLGGLVTAAMLLFLQLSITMT